ncbi:hypothetical protein [Thermococcus sp.]|uniref:hypothetical protein n=1 Tax=Thermococcus sp. TaxID=35749 RepID=UPI002617DB75|nr:hypothetical protein [Thermococcus sp.]
MVKSNRIRLLRILVPLVASIPLAWSLSTTWIGELVLSMFRPVVDTTDPLPLMLLLTGTLSIIGSLAVESVFKLVLAQLLLFMIPTLWGTPLSALKGYTLGGILFSILLILAYYLEPYSGGGSFTGDDDSLIAPTLTILALPIVAGTGFLILILYWSDLGSRPPNLLPLWILLPLLVGIAALISAGYAMKRAKNTGEEVLNRLILRTVMTAGDTFRVEPLAMDGRSVSLALQGGSPVRRPLLLTLDLEYAPTFVMLRSPWESRMLTKKYEWVENGVRYVVYSDTTSRASSSQDIPSALQ